MPFSKLLPILPYCWSGVPDSSTPHPVSLEELIHENERGEVTRLLILFRKACCKLDERGIRKGLGVNFILINQSNGSYVHDAKIDNIKFYSAQLNCQF